MRRQGTTRQAPLLLAGALAVVTGCLPQTRIEPFRMNWAMRGGGHWVEMGLPSVEIGPGGPRRQSVTAAVSPRLMRGRDDEGRVEGAFQLRLHLWRIHQVDNNWTSSSRRFDPNDPNLRRVPCGGHFHVQEYDGRAFREAFSVGVLVEENIGGEGRWVPDGLDSRGRPQHELTALRLGGGGSAGVFARAVIALGVSFNFDAGWEYAYGEAAPYLRAGIGLPFDLSIDRSLPRLPDQP